MGKNKAQRTKNNAKPSSSGRSAELLGTAVPNFVGFSAVKDGGYVPILPGLAISTLNEVEINTIDSNYQLVLKKMNKKDATTKCKALQEFVNLCNTLPLSSVEAVLPFWPRLYHTLAGDIEHRVRESVQLAHAALVKRVGRNIAQYLKQLAGPWFTSQFDTYPLAASAATNSFQETFPSKKYIDAIVHCQDEILSYISNNIIVQTPESMNTNKTNNLTSDELEAKYQRLLICNLQGYCYYFKKVPLQHIEKTINIHQGIISNGKFWKHAKHESSLVKSAFYNVLAAIINNAKVLLDNEKKRTMTAIMNSLDESEPGILSAVWECMLVAIDNIDDWYNIVSIEKLTLPKLWRVLRSGGQGCASVVYPSLLPFISQFPRFNVDDKKNLFIQFFDNMRDGFNVKTVQMSRSEMMAITKSFAECLRYTILLNNDNIELCEKLLTDQLMPVIESSIKEYSPLKAILFNEIAELLRYWSKNRECEYKSYSRLISKFWREFELISQQLIKNSNNEFDQVAILNVYDAQLQFLLSLKYKKDLRCKNTHVRFADMNNVESQQEESLESKIISFEDDKIFFNELYQFVEKLCYAYSNNGCQTPTTHMIIYLNRLISNFESKSIFKSIAKAYINNDDLLEFYNCHLKNWLLEKNIETMAIVRFIFVLIKYMDNDEKNSVLNSIEELNDESILNNAIKCILSEKNTEDRLVKNWCKNNHVTKHLVELAKKLVMDEEYNRSSEHILLMAFESSNGDLNVSEDAINNVAIILCEFLKKSGTEPVEHFVELTSRLLEHMWNYKKLINSSLDILKTLFELDIRDKLSVDIKESTRGIWIDGFSMIYNKLEKNQLFEIQKNCMKIIYEKINQFNDTNINEIVNVTVDFIQASNNNNHDDILNMIVQFNCAEKDVFDIWIPQVTDIVLHAEIISGNFHLANPIQSIPLNRPPTFIVSENEKLPNRMAHCLQWALFNAQMLNKLIPKLNINYEISSDESNYLSDLPNILNGILLIASLAKLYCNHYKLTDNYNTMNDKFKLLAIECQTLRQCIPQNIWNKIITNSESVDDYWMEFGSIFAEFSVYYYGEDKFTSLVNNEGSNILKKYLQSENTALTLVDHINAVVLARNLLNDIKNYSLCSEILRKMINRHEIDRDFLLFNRDIGNIEWSNFCLPIEIIRLCTKFVDTVPGQMTTGMWDAVMIFLASWQQTLNKSKHHDDDLKLRCFTVAISQLFCAIQSLMNKHKEQTINELPPKLLDEWKNVFLDDAHRQIANVWMYYANSFNKKDNYLTPILILQYLGDAMKLLDGNTFFQSYSGYSTVTITSDQLMKFSCKLILSSVPSLQLAAYYSISHLIPRYVEQDKNTIEQENFDIKSLNICKFKNILLNAQKVINNMLIDFTLCDDISCIVQPYTDSYTYTFGYLLAWANVLNMCSHAHADLRYQYGEILKDELFSSLMNNIFRLMPLDALQDNKTKITSTYVMEMFKNSPAFNFHDVLSKLDHVVCWVYGNCLRHLPVLARQWWSTTDSRVGNVVERITTMYVSPVLCQEELTNEKLNNVANLHIKVHVVAREVVATYEMDDTKLELNMILPINYPLGPVVVEPGQHAGSAAIRRNCHMQLSIFLTHQNGSIWDALMMWKKNLDKKFAGVEECYICFSIFHINTSQIPKLSCHTCRKKFHAPCLYKWFSTSQKSTCPICRNIF
ncbi:hypothetical protein PV327_000484 [Microctonus hyperodae]|uniref:E3 ubiquitin-protein ligase listerin n=1 Tax=Microctonus hyperodae TaxID=165561 RepID=A0AA39L280_MICHY|nr:hypothetical protein PV327_000484 [Microctonus hyperodae]